MTANVYLPEYSCPCGKKGSHDHGRKFRYPTEGFLVTDAGRFVVMRTGSYPTWRAIRTDDLIEEFGLRPDA